MTATKPVSCRHMLPVEMSIASLAALPMGLNILALRGPLWHVINAEGGLVQNIVWGLAFLVPAILLFAVASIEWRLGRRWLPSRLMLAAEIRFWCAVVLMIAFSSLLWLFLQRSLFDDVPGAWLVSVQAIPFLAWSSWKTRRLAIVLDPNLPTERLRETIITERW